MEILSCTLSGAKKGGFLVGFSVGGRGVDVKVPYLLFTDDTFIIIYDACKEHMKQLNWVLMWFEAMEGGSSIRTLSNLNKVLLGNAMVVHEGWNSGRISGVVKFLLEKLFPQWFP
ncbi:hypothetical protein CK203_025807 [Vitis vinifera]|uniref:Reverse transcriptase domain-containing protein n=1 Tax=Vitis vinifera TaxID=29760 RepID=A0A438IGM7_VITVI|nr:hypothetical protein CK203_025807 [Vitis vinifera]